MLANRLFSCVEEPNDSIFQYTVDPRVRRGRDHPTAGSLRQGTAAAGGARSQRQTRLAPGRHGRRHAHFARRLRRLPEGSAARQAGNRCDPGGEESGPGSDDQHAAHRRASRERRPGKGSGRRHPHRPVAHADSGGRRRAEVREEPTSPSDQELHAAYDAATDKTEYHAAHILVPTKEKAEQLIKKIKGGAKFEDVAKAESTDNSKTNGGDLGWFTTARMVKPFGDAVKTLKKGDITQRARADPVRLAHHQARSTRAMRPSTR